MIESHINEGRQDVPKEGPGGLKWGVSITDACVGWDVTVGMLASLNEVIRLNASLRCVWLTRIQAVKARRESLIAKGLQKSLQA
jgi:hypothetical protein